MKVIGAIDTEGVEYCGSNFDIILPEISSKETEGRQQVQLTSFLDHRSACTYQSSCGFWLSFCCWEVHRRRLKGKINGKKVNRK